VSRLLRTAAGLGGLALALPAAAAAHGKPVPVSQLSTAWRLDPVVLGLAALALVLFAQAFVRLRRRGRTDHASWGRAALFVAAVATATLPLVSPLDAVGDQYLMSVHMLQHVLIGDLALALALLAVRGPLGLFLLPPFVLRPLGRARPVRAAVGFLLRPSVAVVAWVLAMGLWHIPSAYDYALTHRNVHNLEHLSFVVAGTLVWAQLIDPARRGRLGIVQRLGFAGLLFALGTVLSDVLIFSFHPLYPAYADQGVRLFGISPLRDQQLAGLVMMSEQLLTLGICAGLLLRAQARRRPARVPRAAQART
jgi:putative membrane protein